MIIKVTPLNDDGTPGGETFELTGIVDIEFLPPFVPMRITRIRETPTSVTFLVEDDMFLRVSVPDEQSTNSD